MNKRRSRRKHESRRPAIAIVVLVVVAVAAAAFVFIRQRELGPDALMARAQQHSASGDYAAAVIDLKSVIAADAGNRKARFQLGQIYLESGNAAGAIKELQKARELGESVPGLDVGLVRAMILTGKFDEAATEMALHGDTGKPEWLVLRGMLDLAQQRLEDARSTFKGILDKIPDNEEARRGLMQAELAAGHADLARAELERLLKSTTKDPMLWTIRGELDLYEGHADKAIESYQHALDIASGDPLANLGMARAQLAAGQPDKATTFVEALGAGAKEDPRANFVRAQIAEAKGDKDAAMLYLRDVLQVAPMHRESLVMAARINFSLGEFTQAEDYVGRLLEIEPTNEAARRMLGAIQLASGRLDGLGQIDPNGGAGASQDPGMLALLGTAYLKYGKFADSEKSLKRAVELAPDSLPIRTQLALSKLSTGKPEEAVTDLQAILAEDPNFVQANIMLALAYLAQKQADTAIATARELVAKHPNDALPHNVLGYVLELTGDKAAAHTEYETAVAKDAAFHPARINLARLAIQNGDRAAGKAQFEAIIEREPFHPFALLGLAALALQSDQVDEAERLWLLAREHNPDAVAPRLLLAKHYRVRKNLVLAETNVKEAYRLAPFAPQVQAEYAVVMLDTGKYDEALKAARALDERNPKSLESLDLLARVYNQLGDEANLTATLQRIADIAPDAAAARVLLGRLAVRRKDYAEVKRIVDALKANDKTAAAGFGLDGEMIEARGDDSAALLAFTRAFELSPDSSTVLKLDRIERRMGKASARLADWLATHPDDLQVRLVHASYLQQSGASSDAISQYEQMLKDKGENPVVLNNLAWLYYEGEDARALELARRAFELAPKQPEIIDTYGWILFGLGQREQGLETLEKAAALAPGNPDIAFHVASALNDAGQGARARQMLEQLLEDEQREFSLKKDAEALLAKIRQ